MSGRGRGRGGASNPLRDAAWYDPIAAKLENRPTALYPSHPTLPTPDPPTAFERAQVAAQIRLVKELRAGPLYTHSTKGVSTIDGVGRGKMFNEEQINAQYASRNDKALFGPFTGMQMWSERFVPKRRHLPEISGPGWDERFLPPELHCVLPNHKPTNSSRPTQAMSVAQRAARIQDHLKTADADHDGHDAVDGDEEEREANDEDPADKDADQNSEAMDDDFEDAEDDMGGDYNAEHYFDNGEGDDDDDDGGADEY